MAESLIPRVTSADGVLPSSLLKPLMQCEHIENADKSSYWLDVRTTDPDCRYTVFV